MKTSSHRSGRSLAALAALVLLPSALPAAPLTWDNDSADGTWSNLLNWDPDLEPTSADTLTFPNGSGGTITLGSNEEAISLLFDDNYNLLSGSLILSAGNNIQVSPAITTTIDSVLNMTGGLTKDGPGTLVLGGNNINTGVTNINLGTLRITDKDSLGGATSVTTVHNGATLEFGDGFSTDRKVTLMDGGTVTGLGTTTTSGVTTVDAAATNVTVGTDIATDIFTFGTGTNDRTGGTAAATINIGGPGTVRLNAASDYQGSWNIPTGVVEINNAGSLGNQNTSGVTLSGGTLSARINSSINFSTASPGNNLTLTADSGLRSDRTSNGGGPTHTFGTLSMGSNTLFVDPGPMVTSGTATIALSDVTLTGDPLLAVNDNGSANGKLATGSLLGGGVPRVITKSGAGDFSVTGGATDLPLGSTFDATGGGTIEMIFPTLGAGATIAVSALQNPFGESTMSITDGGLNLRANGSNTNAVQVYEIPTTLTMGGTVFLDPNEVSGNNSQKTFEFPGLTLASGTDLTIIGDNTHGIGLSGPLDLQGSVTLKGIDITSRDGRFTLDGGITGAPGTALNIEGGISPMNLTINASSTYGGGTTMSGSNVTLNAVNSFGTGSTVISDGSLTTNIADALAGMITLNGGSLRANGPDFLANNPILLDGGTLNIRSNDHAVAENSGLSVNGISGLTIGRDTSGSSKVIDFSVLNVLGNTDLTVTNNNGFVADFLDIDLAGNLTLTTGGTSRIQELSEDASARTLLKAGTGTLELEGASTHSGGTEVLRGTLLVQHQDGLGTGALTIGDSSGTNTATARFDAGLTIANNLVARSGGTGNLTLDASAGNVTWNGNVDLQRTLRLDNGSSTQTSFMNGLLSGAGDIDKISAGEIVLSNAANSFGSGALDSILITDGRLAVTSDAALGNPANSVTLAGTDGVLKIDGTFSSSRALTFTGTSTGVAVTAGNDFTMLSPLEGTGAFLKSDAGTMILPTGLDSSARGAATSGLAGGILRLQSQKGLSDAGPVTFNSNSGGTLELLMDPDTDFAHPITHNNIGTIHVDRALGGAGTNGRHTMGPLTTTSGSGTLTITGDNGYGLSIPSYTTAQNKTLLNNAPGELQIGSIDGNPGTQTRTLTLGGSGDLTILGDLTQGAGTGTYRFAKNGEGTLRLGTSVTGFGDRTTVRDGVLDLNGLTYLSEDLDLGGVSSASGAQILTSGGTLQLATGVTFSSGGTPAGAKITGTVDLTSLPQIFNVNNSTIAPVDLEVEGPLTGTSGSSLTKNSTGTLLLSGAGNSFPGSTTVTSGTLELGKSSGDGIGSGGLTVTNSTVSLLGSEQINDTAPILINGTNTDTKIELNSFTETIGLTTIQQTDAFDYAGIRTGATGTLILSDDLTLSNNSNSSGTDARNILITGTGNDFTPTTDGILDLGGVTRTINVTTTTVGANEPDANATIETQIINGGILKTGPRALYLNHPTNTFSGGIQIANGTVVPASAGSLGSGGFSFSNTGTNSAGIDLGGLTGTLADPFNITGSGSGTTTITYSAPKGDSLTLSGGFTLERDLAFDVVNGSINDGDAATLELTGIIDDGVDTANLTKVGKGLLILPSPNTFSGGTTIEMGTLSITADDALGDTTAPLIITGGNLRVTQSTTLTRSVTMGANGGSIQVDGPHTLDIPDTLTWGASGSAFHGSGTTILSGTTSGTGSDLWIGNPTDFADTSFLPNVGLGQVLSLRGTSALPTGNLRITKNAVLELGTGDFTRSLGTGPGEFYMDTARGAGWAAHGADRIVNIGGAGATVTWGQQSPAFLYRAVSGNDYGDLILGSSTASHTVDFQNPIELDAGTSSAFRAIVVHDGPASLDAKVSGNITQSSATTFTSLSIEGTGDIEISGNLGSDMGISNYTTGTLTLSGTNSFDKSLETYFGTLVISNDAAFGTPSDIFFEDGSNIDASGMTSPLSVPSDGFFSVNANLTGSVETASYFEGNGSVSGDVHLLPGAYFFPNTGSQLQIGGDLTLDATTFADFFIQGLVPDVNFNRVNVTGTVSLAGDLGLNANNISDGDSFVLINNDGVDAIVGTFASLPEGAGIPVGNGLGALVSYVAGDGNDFGVSIVPDTFSSDLILTVDAPLAVDLNGTMNFTYTIVSTGPGDVTDGELIITLPANATFVSSSPAGTITTGVLTVPLPTLTGIDSTTVTLTLTAPAIEGTVFVEADVSSTTPELETFNNSAPSLSAIFAGGIVMANDFSFDTSTNMLHLNIDTVDGIEYIFECSTNLINWSPIDFVSGDGLAYDNTISIDPSSIPKKFYRFCILPFNGGGGPEE